MLAPKASTVQPDQPYIPRVNGQYSTIFPEPPSVACVALCESVTTCGAVGLQARVAGMGITLFI